MTTPAIEIPSAETKANLRWSLPVWLVAICSAIVLIGAIAAFLFIYIYLRSEDYSVLPASKTPVINTTPIHAYSALFGVYGSLTISLTAWLRYALMLFPLREITPESAWNEKLWRFSFWSINGELVAMLFFGLISSGFYRLVASVNYGTRYARSTEIINHPWMEWTVWLRMPGDLLLALGAVALFIFTLGAVISIFSSWRSPAPDSFPLVN